MCNLSKMGWSWAEELKSDAGEAMRALRYHRKRCRQMSAERKWINHFVEIKWWTTPYTTSNLHLIHIFVQSSSFLVQNQQNCWRTYNRCWCPKINRLGWWFFTIIFCWTGFDTLHWKKQCEVQRFHWKVLIHYFLFAVSKLNVVW